jgi:hypothetical protein
MSGANESRACEILSEYTRTMAQCRTGFETKAVFSEICRGLATSVSQKQRTAETLRPPAQKLLADAEFPNDSFVALGIVSLEVIEQATPLADQHKQAAARAVVLLVRFEVIRQLANAFTDDGDLNLRTPGVSRVRLILVNDRFLLLSG